MCVLFSTCGWYSIYVVVSSFVLGSQAGLLLLRLFNIGVLDLCDNYGLEKENC